MNPPQWLLRFFRWFCHPDFVEDIEGDLHERYKRKVNAVGKRKVKANWFFFKEVLSLFRPGIIRPIKKNHPHIPFDMYKHFIKIAWRNLFKNKFFSIINIGGLAAGMLVPMLIGLWIYDELSFNKQYENSDRIAQVMQNQINNGEIETWFNQAMQLEPELRNNFGNHFKYIVTTPGTWNHLLTYEGKKITKSGSFMGPDIIGMLSIKMLEGVQESLEDPTAIFLAASTAEALFGDTDPMDKGMLIDNELVVTVKGIYEDLPINSEFGRLTFIAPWVLHVQSENLKERVTWGNSWFNTYVQIAENTDMQKISDAIKDVKYNNIEADYAKITQPELFLHPMNNWYLCSKFKNGVNAGGRIEYVWLFGIIAIFVLLLACINFMNLSTARSEKRAKEVGVRKTLGSLRCQLVSQFFSESLLVTGLAFLFSTLLAFLLMPTFNEVAGKQLTIPWANPWFWLIGISFALFTGLVAGSYPSAYLSAFKPIKVLKGTFRTGRLAALPRKVLVVIQFTVSISLIIGTIFVFRQIQFAKDRPIGYNRDNLIRIPIKTDELITHFQALRSDLLNTGMVEEMAGTDSPITATHVTNGGFDWKGKDPNMSNDFTSLRVTHEFGQMVDWEIIEGRDFSKDFATDTSAYILNEAAVAYMGLEHPVGTIMTRGGNNFKIVGVVKNLITQSPYDPVRQTIFMLHETWLSHINIKLKPESSAHQALAQIETVFKKYDPVNALEYEFADQAYARKFRNEERIGKLSSFFAILAIFISCLGLFGLAAYVAEQRTKEIGIRKVLGASISNLWQMLSKDFLYLVFFSCFLAAPISYYLMHNWLEDFTYRIELSWWVFALVGLFAIAITLLTVSFQALKAALMSPVKSIKNE
ncbi:MAG: FtsX-like permease family protein [Saprospiraceae bacterium]